MRGEIDVQRVMRQVEARKDWQSRQERFVEYEALKQLSSASDEAERQQVRELYSVALERVWKRRGYHPQWIAQQLGDYFSS